MNATETLKKIAKIRRNAEVRWLFTRTPAAWEALRRAVADERALIAWAQLA